MDPILRARISQRRMKVTLEVAQLGYQGSGRVIREILDP
jgi:hypothetical protein